MHSRINLTAPALVAFGAGNTVRVRLEDGVISIKSSTRPRAVKEEFSFGSVAGDTLSIPALLQAGDYTLEAAKYSWVKLVPADAATATVTITNVEAPVAPAVVDAPAA
jgi:hypothetical protein